jgi:hypothetical protein
VIVLTIIQWVGKNRTTALSLLLVLLFVLEELIKGFVSYAIITLRLNTWWCLLAAIQSIPDVPHRGSLLRFCESDNLALEREFRLVHAIVLVSD